MMNPMNSNGYGEVSQKRRLAKVLNLANAIFYQKREGKNKVYSVHAREVEYIAKVKVSKDGIKNEQYLWRTGR